MNAKLMRQVVTLILLCIFFTPFASYGDSNEPYKIGVLSFNEKNDTLEKWSPLAEYLTESLNTHSFVIVPLFYEEMDQAVQNGDVDFIFTNPGHFVELKTKYHLSGAIATLIEKDGDLSQYEFGGVIFTKATNDRIHALKDLKGKTISAVSKSSLGGYQAQAFELQRNNLNLEKDLSFVFTGMPHSNAVFKVLNGETDAGFVRTGVLEKMSLEGLIDLGDLKVLQDQNFSGFNHLISTALYPEWPFAAASHMDIDTSRAVASMLLLFKPEDDYTKNMGIYGFNIPSNYLGVEEMMRGLGLPPFDQSEPMSFEEVWNRYRFYVIGSFIILIALLVGLTYKSYSERKVKQLNRDLNTTMLKLEINHEQIKYLFNHMHDGFALHEMVLGWCKIFCVK